LPLPVRRGGGGSAEDGDEVDAGAGDAAPEGDVAQPQGPAGAAEEGTRGEGDAGGAAAARRAPSRNGRRRVSRARLEQARARAASLLAQLEAGPPGARADAHLEWLQALVGRELGWRAGRPGCEPLLDALAALAGELPADLALAREEFARLVADALS